MSVSEVELVLKAQNNSMSAFRELVERYKKKIYYTALSIVKTHQDAEDMMQETMVQALRSIKKLNKPAGFGSWILRIAHNRSIDFIRKRGREVRPQEDESGFSMFDLIEAEGSESDPQRKIESEQITKAIVKIMDELPDSQRKAFELKHLSQLSIKEIADITNSSESTVKTNIFRAVQKMRNELTGYLEKQAGFALSDEVNPAVS